MPDWLLARVAGADPTKPLDLDQGPILVGRRNAELFRIGCALRGKGAAEGRILDELLVENMARCEPPLGNDEVRQIARSCARYEAGEGGKASPKLEENQAAEILAPMLATRLGCDETSGRWLAYTGSIWQTVPDGAIERRVLGLLKAIKPGFQHRYLAAVVKLLRYHLPAPSSNTDRALLPFANGVLNLATGALTPYVPDLGFDWSLPFEYSPDAECPQFIDWLYESLYGDEEAIHLVRCWLAAVIRGLYRLQKFLEVIGPGGTGKSTLLKVAGELVGPANTVSTTLRQLEGNRHETAALRHKRLALITDSEQYPGPLDTLKALTGGDPVRFEPKYIQQGGASCSRGC